MKNITEQEIQTKIQNYLKENSWFVYKNNLSGVKHGSIMCKNPTAGCADLTAIKNSQVVMIEVKLKENKQSIKQIEFEKEWTNHGGIYWLIHSLEELINKLNTSFI
jgi:hypothetical protein